jgi:hypothetical protein
MDNLFKLINEKHYVGYYLPYNSVGEVADSILEEPFGLKNKYHVKQSFDGKHCVFTFDKSVNGDKEEFEKNYGNPLCDTSVYRSTLVVEENEDKICLKVFYCGKHRRAGEVFYRKSTRLNYITFNKKTNIFTVGRNTEYHKKRGKGKSTVVRRNTFPISLITESYSSFMNGLDDHKTYGTEVINGINTFLSKIGAETIKTYDKLPMSLFGCLLDKQGIKKPDNWRGYYEIYPKPTKKDYQKNGFKFVDTYMSLHNISSEKVKKIIHKVQRPCFTSIVQLIKVFGKDFILQRPDEELCEIFSLKNDDTPFMPTIPDLENFKKRDLYNCYRIYYLCKKESFSQHTFYDHIRFFSVLSKYEPIRWNSTTLKELLSEHAVWSDKVDFYTQGKYSRMYSDEFVEKISKPIEMKDGQVFTPVILQNSNEYVDESAHQSNCVRTYQDRPSSLIISLRKENGDRASIEYLPSIGKFALNDTQPIHFNRVQTLGKFNQSLDESWDDAIFQLDVRLKTINQNMWGTPTAEFVTGGSKKEYEFLFDDNGRLCWTNTDDSIYIGDDLPYIDF